MTKIGGPFPFNGIVVTREYLKQEPEILRRFMKGYVEGISGSLKNRERTLKIIGQYSRTSDPEILVLLPNEWVIFGIFRSLEAYT